MLPGLAGPVLTGFPKLLPQELLQGHPLTSPNLGDPTILKVEQLLPGKSRAG